MRHLISLGALCAAVTVTALGAAAQTPTVRTATGATPGELTATVSAFVADLGGSNNGGQPAQTSGHRNVNWDGTPDADSSPSRFPGDFFNKITTRGIEFKTLGTSFQVSADDSNPAGAAPLFGNLNAAHATNFAPFTTQRIFTSVGSNVIDIEFRRAGTNIKACVRGFGAVFCDVDTANATTLAFYSGSRLLGTHAAQALSGSATLSFLGVTYVENIITHVRMTLGNATSGPSSDDVTNGAGLPDVVAVDDLFYDEPQKLEPWLLIRALPEAIAQLGSSSVTWENRLLRDVARIDDLGVRFDAAITAGDVRTALRILDQIANALGRVQVEIVEDVPTAAGQELVANHLGCLWELLVERKRSLLEGR